MGDPGSCRTLDQQDVAGHVPDFDAVDHVGSFNVEQASGENTGTQASQCVCGFCRITGLPDGGIAELHRWFGLARRADYSCGKGAPTFYKPDGGVGAGVPGFA